jgi:hypothetical protein
MQCDDLNKSDWNTRIGFTISRVSKIGVACSELNPIPFIFISRNALASSFCSVCLGRQPMASAGRLILHGMGVKP